MKKLNKSLDVLSAASSLNEISKSTAANTLTPSHEKNIAKKKRKRNKRKFSERNDPCSPAVDSSRTVEAMSCSNNADVAFESDSEFEGVHAKKQKCGYEQEPPKNLVVKTNCIQSRRKDPPDASLTLPTPSKQSTCSLNPLKQGEQLLREMLKPIVLEEFFRVNYQKTPLHAEHSGSKCGEWLNFSFFEKILDEEFLFFGQHIDLIEGKTLQDGIVNPPGRAFAGTVWEHYSHRKGLRFHNLQTFSRRLRFRIGLLQEYFGSNFTVTAYLFPSKSTELSYSQLNSDIFILQQEGSQSIQISRFRNFRGLSQKYHFFSFFSFSNDKMHLKGQNKRALLVKLKSGDLLYIPQGYTCSISHSNVEHSLHLCISFNQKYNWGNYLSELLSIMMKYAVENDPEFNKPLPLDSFKHLGIFFNKDSSSKSAVEFEKEFRLQSVQLLKRLISKIEQRQTFSIQKSKFLNHQLNEDKQCSLLSSAKEIDSTKKKQPNPYDNLFIHSVDPLHLAIDEIMLKIMKKSCSPELSEGSDKLSQLTVNSKIRLVRSTAVRLMLTYFQSKDSTILAADDSSSTSRKCAMIPSFMVYHSLNNQDNNSDSNACEGIGFHKNLNVAITFYKLGFLITEDKLHQINDDADLTTTTAYNEVDANLLSDSVSIINETRKHFTSSSLLSKNNDAKHIDDIEDVCLIDDDENNLTDDEDDDCIVTGKF
ncbi:Lysine-specific demethylase NO66 [Schistosoma japonicum]|nr:Lysine-specific demethylase NO66 [Schistosoma japonicum]